MSAYRFCPWYLGGRSRVDANSSLAYLGCDASQAVSITPAAGVCACGPQDSLVVEDGEGEPAIGDEHYLECVDLPGEGASCAWLHSLPHIKGPFSSKCTAKHGSLSISTAYPNIEGQGQNTWSRHGPQLQRAQTPVEAEALPQPNPQNLCGRNKNKEEKQLLILGFTLFGPLLHEHG